MAKVRNISGEALTVPGLGGFGGGRLVAADEVVDVVDDDFDGYVYPNSAWESVEPPAGYTAPADTPPAQSDGQPADEHTDGQAADQNPEGGDH